MKKEVVEKILAETETGYDQIAEKFSETRKRFWSDLEFIKDYARKGDRILDFGCGNGRLLELLNGKNIEYSGVDVSQKLIDIASEKYPGGGRQFMKIASSGRLPFPDNYFNVVYSIAVFHHLPGRDLRVGMAKEICRTLKPGGRIIITVWNLYQPKYFRNLLDNWLGKLKGQSNLDWKDCRIPFSDNQGKRFERYHHAFTKRELRILFQGAGFKIERCDAVGGRNLVLIGGKLPK